jgi:hypothetical protein
MSFIKQKQVLCLKESNPSTQTTTPTYTEIAGSKAELTNVNSSAKFIYKFCFHISVTASGNKWFLHIKLQKSTDNFSSDINDVPGANYNVASDSVSVVDHLYRLNTAFFVVDNLTGTNQLRLVCRAYSTSLQTILHESLHYDGVSNPKIFDPSLIVFEV